MQLIVFSLILFMGVLSGTSSIELSFLEDSEIARRYFSENRFDVRWHEGEPYYGYHYSAEYHFCSNGGYWVSGNSWKRTVLDNIQRSNWNDRGSWSIITHQGVLYLQLYNQDGETQHTQIVVTPSGQVRIVMNGEVKKVGRASCG